MMDLTRILAKAVARPRALSAEELEFLIDLDDPVQIREMQTAAYALKCRHCGKVVSMRGLVELGNVCAKDCLYCGIRRSNTKVARYHLTPDEVERLAEICRDENYASIVLQSGEIESEANTAYVEECLRRILKVAPLGVTLSLGEQTEDVYRRWRDAGAARYLLRVETSNPELYARLHPAGHSWERRVECLRALRRCGYQVGTGVMSCLPSQTSADLARDIVFFGDLDVDMIGMGPYIPHPDTPLAHQSPNLPIPQLHNYSISQSLNLSIEQSNNSRLRTGLNMISATRLYLHDVNIAATTALQTLACDGRERGIRAGANVMMPNLTDVKYRRSYQLYEGKPNLDENALDARVALERSLAAIGETVNYGHRGDSAHYFARSQS